ncbi:MAG: class I SAM-dependent methyltransferase [Pirellulales bacterium]
MQSEQFQLHADIEQRHWWFRGRRTIMRRLVERIVPGGRPGGRPLVIDVGCGTGANIAALATDYRCVGIDTSAEAIDRAGRRYPGVDFRVGLAPDDLEDCLGEARLVMLMDVLEHVPDDFALLSRLLAASRPGTQFLITVPADLDLWSEHDESFGHWRRYDMDRFMRLWRDLPVEPRLVSHYNARLYPVVRHIRRRNRRRGHSQGAAGTDFTIPARPINAMLERIFAGEARRLGRQLEDRKAVPYRQGVSLIAVLRRTTGSIEPFVKPADIASDYFDPIAGELIAAVS